MLLPFLLISLAVLAAAVFAYGTEAAWASLSPHGIELILWSRRLQWPLIVTAILLCIGLGILVISGRCRTWWLIGLLPVLVLFYHRFTAGPAVAFASVQDPPFVSADRASFVHADDQVIGLMMDGSPFAFPYAQMFRTPVVVLTGREKPTVLLWSPLANRAMGFSATREVRASDLEIISDPGNALLVFNTRLGQFINGVTGRTFAGETPTGFQEPTAVFKMDWKAWLALHPATKVMAMTPADGPAQPVLPRYALRGIDPMLKDERSVCMVASTQPIAVPSELITDRPLNLMSGETPLLLVRINGIVLAFSREMPGDLVPRFAARSDPKHTTVAWTDSDTHSEWSLAGEVVDGAKEIRGAKLQALPVEDGLYLNVMKYWYPELSVATASDVSAGQEEVPVHHDSPVVSKHRKLKRTVAEPSKP